MKFVGRPFGFTVAVKVTLVAPTFVAGPVVTVGAGSVRNVRSSPVAVPTSFVAMTREWYHVPGERPVTSAESVRAEVPLPALPSAVREP